MVQVNHCENTNSNATLAQVSHRENTNSNATLAQVKLRENTVTVMQHWLRSISVKTPTVT